MPDVTAATAKLENSNKNDLALLRQDTAPSIVRACQALYRDLLAANRRARDPRLAVEFAGQQLVSDVAAARAKANAALDSAEQGMRQAVSNVRADIASKTETTRDTAEATLYELQLAAARRRIDQAQAAGVDVSQTIQRAAALGDTATLAALRQDLPLAAGSSRQDQAHLEALMLQLDAAETPLLSGLQQAARQIEQELADGLSQQSTGLGLARMYANGQRTIPQNLPDWAKGKTLQVAFTTPDGGLDVPDTPKASGTTGYPPAPPTPNYGKYNP